MPTEIPPSLLAESRLSLCGAVEKARKLNAERFAVQGDTLYLAVVDTTPRPPRRKRGAE